MMKMKPIVLKGLYAALLMFCAVMVMTFATSEFSGKIQASVSAAKQTLTGKKTIVIDAGHGGMDGGAESKSGVCEKDINLAIALKIKELAEDDGWEVIMTREDDRLLKKSEFSVGDAEKKSIRMTKAEDLAARKSIIDREKPFLAVSIHLNSFKEDPRVRGAQVFYTNSGNTEEEEQREILENSRELGEMVQKKLVEGIKDGTNRSAMGKKDARILKNPTVPTVIVECGFLSNADEAELLADKKYQNSLAAHIYKGIMEYGNKAPMNKVSITDSRV